MTKDLPIANFYESIRQFHIVDDADGIHKRTIAHEVFADRDFSELDPVITFDA